MVKEPRASPGFFSRVGQRATFRIFQGESETKFLRIYMVKIRKLPSQGISRPPDPSPADAPGKNLQETTCDKHKWDESCYSIHRTSRINFARHDPDSERTPSVTMIILRVVLSLYGTNRTTALCGWDATACCQVTSQTCHYHLSCNHSTSRVNIVWHDRLVLELRLAVQYVIMARAMLSFYECVLVCRSALLYVRAKHMFNEECPSSVFRDFSSNQNNTVLTNVAHVQYT